MLPSVVGGRVALRADAECRQAADVRVANWRALLFGRLLLRVMYEKQALTALAALVVVESRSCRPFGVAGSGVHVSWCSGGCLS